jgi:hypothetical protein
MAATAKSVEPKKTPWNGIMACAGAATLTGVLIGSYLFGDAAGAQLTRNTIRLSLAWYAAGLMWMVRLDSQEWTASTTRGQIARWCWTWGVVAFFVHLAMAFHFYHHWSHSHAFQHTREVSGFGEGIYFSYLFTLMWMVDTFWWWGFPARYAARPVWIDRILHTYMLFIILNGTIVFESGAIRWVSLAMFGVLVVAWTLSAKWGKDRSPVMTPQTDQSCHIG